jgi:Flp pilus assembly protein TadG
MPNGSTNREHGIALILTSLATVFLSLFTGLAVDATLLMVIKGRLSAAVDAAALGAGRSLNLGSTPSEANAFASAAGQAFFSANFPQGYLGVAPFNPATAVTSTFNQSSNGTVNIAVSASVSAPVYFMRLANFSNVTLTSTGTASRRGLVMMMVLDISGSMNNYYNGSTACQTMVQAAANFANNFSAYDELGLVAFESIAHLKYPISSNWKVGNALVNEINSLTCTSSTNTTAALNLAYGQIKSANQPLALNAIVLFTDGMPNSISAAYPLRTQADQRYGFGGGPSGCANNNARCNMPVCTTTSGTVTGAISQWPNFLGTGHTSGLSKDFDSDPTPSGFPSGCPTNNDGLRQTLAYIPDTDRFGNSTHGFNDTWVYPVNWQCNPSGTCAYTGGLFTNYPTVGSGSNFFQSGPYTGKWRFDQPTSIGAASMNSAINQANAIRSDTNYNVIIHSIFLLGNGTDPVQKYFLPFVSNLPEVPPLPLYEPTGTAAVPNPYYDSTQQQGLFFAASDKSQLAGLFAKIASSLLRLSH